MYDPYTVGWRLSSLVPGILARGQEELAKLTQPQQKQAELIARNMIIEQIAVATSTYAEALRRHIYGPGPVGRIEPPA